MKNRATQEDIELLNHKVIAHQAEHLYTITSLQWRDETAEKVIHRIEEERYLEHKFDSEINRCQFTVYEVTLDDIAVPDQYVMHYTTTPFDDQIVKVTYSVSHHDKFADPDFDALFSNHIKEESNRMNNLNTLMTLFVKLLQQTIITELGEDFYLKTYNNMESIYQLEWTEEKKINDNLLDLYTVATAKVKHIAELIMFYSKEFKQKLR